MRRVIVTDRRDAPLFELAEADVFELRRDEEVNGEHALTITTTRVLREGWRVLMEDARGIWREWVVYSSDALHESGARPIGTYYCVWSLMADLMGTRVSRMPGVQSPVAAAVALEAALSGTSRWSVGTVTQTASAGASMYDMSGWAAMSVLVANWGGEVDARVDVGANFSISRQCCLYSQQGEQAAKRRFDFGADLASVRRAVAPGPLYCRIAPRGRGEATEGGGYGRKVTIESVNDGKDYLENADMVELAKLPDGAGGWEYPTLEVENSQCETPADLLAWAQGVLEESTLPKVTYEVDGIQAAAEGVDAQGVSLGDAVHVVDAKFDGLRLEGRVIAISTDELLERNVELRIGSLSKGVSDILGETLGGLRADMSAIEGTVKAMNGGTMSTANYLTRLLDRLNEEINAGGGYTYIVPGHGILTYDVAVADPLNPAEASNVVEIKGGTIRIADTKTAQGEWEWKTVILSGHLAAEVVTSANLVSGFIGSPSGNFWNLDTGELRMATTTQVGATTLEDVLHDVGLSSSSVDMEYAQNQSRVSPPDESSSDWSTQAPGYREGYYIWQRMVTRFHNGTIDIADPICISGRDGQTGTNAATIMLYQRSAVQPATSDITAITYEFATSAITSGSTGAWSRNIPAGTDTCWVVMASAIGNNATDTIAPSEWSAPVALSSAGVDGLNQATVFLFRRKPAWRYDADELVAPDASSMSFSGTIATVAGSFDGTALVLAPDAPDAISSDSTYTFASGELSPVPSGWSRSIPAGDDPVWATTAAAVSNTSSTVIDHGDWAAPVLFSDSPEPVTVHGVKYAVGANGTTAPTTGWQSSVPAAQQGRWLWCRTTYSDGTVSDTCSYMGEDGKDGVSVHVQSSSKSGKTTTVKLVDSEGNETTMTIEDGEDGPQGVAGAKGYTHIAWADSVVYDSQGAVTGVTGFSTSVSQDKSYIGTYADNTLADSERYQDYSWSRIKGDDGLNHATINLYRRASSAPAKPSATLTYYFETNTLSGSLGGWSQSVPSGTAPCWVIAATAASQGPSDTIPSGEWTTPVKAFENGAAGSSGLNQATVYLYRRASSAPAKPSAAVTYTFATGALSSVPSGWSRTIPSGTSPCYVTTAVAISTEDTDTIAASEWSDVTMLVQNGARGATGQGVSSVTELWYLSTSQYTQTGGEWKTTQDPWEHGKFLWSKTRTLISGESGSTYYETDPVLCTALNNANEQAYQTQRSLVNLQTQEAIFNLLTNNGAIQGLYMHEGQLYVNASYILSGIMKLGGANNVNGVLQVLDANGNVVSTLDKDGADMTGAIRLRMDGYTSAGKIFAELATFVGYDISGNRLNLRGLHIYSENDRYNNDIAILAKQNNLSTAESAITSKGSIRIYSHYEDTNTGSFILLGSTDVWLKSKVSSSTDNGLLVGPTQIYTNGLLNIGSLQVRGSKSRIAETRDYGTRALYCYETPSPMFGDVGSGTIAEDGLCYVEVDAVFSETARTDFSYQVFLQKRGQGDLWVAEKSANYFVVQGTPGLAFDWEMKARQTGFESLRLEDSSLDEAMVEESIAYETPEQAYAEEYAFADNLEELLAA